MAPLQKTVRAYEESENELMGVIDECKFQIENRLSRVRENCRLYSYGRRVAEDDELNSFVAQDEAIQRIEADLTETKVDMEKNSQVGLDSMVSRVRWRVYGRVGLDG